MEPTVMIRATLVSGLLFMPLSSHAATEADLASQVDALTAQVTELNARVATMVGQIATLATVLVSLQAQSAVRASDATGFAMPASIAGKPGGDPAPMAAGTPPTSALMVKGEGPDLPRPAPEYRFLGYLDQAGEERAFLAKGREILIVRRGDTVGRHLEVTGISPSEVTFRDARTGAEVSFAAEPAE